MPFAGDWNELERNTRLGLKLRNNTRVTEASLKVAFRL